MPIQGVFLASPQRQPETGRSCSLSITRPAMSGKRSSKLLAFLVALHLCPQQTLTDELCMGRSSLGISSFLLCNLRSPTCRLLPPALSLCPFSRDDTYIFILFLHQGIFFFYSTYTVVPTLSFWSTGTPVLHVYCINHARRNRMRIISFISLKLFSVFFHPL